MFVKFKCENKEDHGDKIWLSAFQLTIFLASACRIFLTATNDTYFFGVCSFLVQVWCSYSTIPLNVLVTQMGSKYKKAVFPESVRESLHSWCKRVKERSKHGATLSVTTRSTCSLESVVDERDEIVTVGSGTLSRCSSTGTLDRVAENEGPTIELETFKVSDPPRPECLFPVEEYPSNSSLKNEFDVENNVPDGEEGRGCETLLELFKRA
ncbi:hypothetical protein NMG60_11032559 [Bertholletia excelsa]